MSIHFVHVFIDIVSGIYIYNSCTLKHYNYVHNKKDMFVFILKLSTHLYVDLYTCTCVKQERIEVCIYNAPYICANHFTKM
jgi:hypothetical protein